MHVWGVCPCVFVRGGALVGFRAAVASHLFVFWMSACCLSFADERPFAHGSWPVNGAGAPERPGCLAGGEPAAIRQQARPDQSGHCQPRPPPSRANKVPPPLQALHHHHQKQVYTGGRNCKNSLLVQRFSPLIEMNVSLGGWGVRL